ncbi:hypothetical protein L596_016473 [Steinernema carpocapsae]|uniref:Uncharacterized protein n=1 Tax=Steinernema carpocapsae TaxID=34508 RepID=A0A4U5NIZ0_STECR|nr:hypothetical protein L596_016473 [Steinernema carpocapsae]
MHCLSPFRPLKFSSIWKQHTKHWTPTGLEPATFHAVFCVFPYVSAVRIASVSNTELRKRFLKVFTVSKKIPINGVIFHTGTGALPSLDIRPVY